MEKIKMQRNLQICKILKICYATTSLAMPSIVGYWSAHGMDYKDITLLEALFAVAVVLFEVPSGYFADCIGRRSSLIIATVFLTLGDFTYALAENFWGFLAAEVFLAAAFAFCSGADSAILRSTLRELGKENEYEKSISNLLCIGFLSMAAAGAVGGVLAGINPALPFWVEGAFGLLAIGSTVFLNEPNGSIRSNRKISLSELFEMTKQAYTGNSKVAWLMFFSAVVNTWIRVSVWLYQPYFEKGGLSIEKIGLVFTAFNLAAAAGSKYFGSHYSKYGASWVKVLAVIALVYVSMGLWIFPCLIWLLPMIHQFIRGIISVCFSGMLRKEIAEEDFATIGSVQSFSAQLTYALVLPGFGASVDNSGLDSTLIYVGLIGLAVSMTVYCYRPKASK